MVLPNLPCPDRKYIETSGDVIEALLVIRKNDVELYFTYFAWHDTRQSR